MKIVHNKQTERLESETGDAVRAVEEQVDAELDLTTSHITG